MMEEQLTRAIGDLGKYLLVVNALSEVRRRLSISLYSGDMGWMYKLGKREGIKYSVLCKIFHSYREGKTKSR